MITKTDVTESINNVRSELVLLNETLTCYDENSEIKISISNLFDAIEEAENIANEYIEHVINITEALEQSIDKLREGNY